MIKFNRFKNGTRHIVTMSYDDSNESDIRLVELFDKYGIKATFNINTNNNPNGVPEKEYKNVYKNHEVAVHTVTHPFLENLPILTQMQEIKENKKSIESAVEYVVRGMAYPFGTYNEEVINTAKVCGIVYGRTTEATNGFRFPRDFMKWHPSCHHADAAKMAEWFVGDLDVPWRTDLFYIWGHSHELRNEKDWEKMEEICKKISGHNSVWYATNIEIYDYITAQRALQISENESIVQNPSAIEVWFEKDENVFSIKPGETLIIK